jgi:membrane associated rhomboid family serine protease
MRGVTFGLPKPTQVVKYLLIINLAAFVLQLICRGLLQFNLSDFFGATLGGWWQLWRYVTFQFLHSPDSLWHLGLNMLGLYMLGTPLERQWGGRRFLKFYLICGATAGVAYIVMAALRNLSPGVPLIGASGGVYGIVLACAVLFPHFRLIFFLFPVPIRLAAVIIFGGMILIVLSSLSSGELGGQFWSDVAHLGGAVAAAVWIWILPRLRGTLDERRQKINQGAWERKMHRRREEQTEIDRILDKIRREGLDSLSRAERNRLQDATRRQKDEERDSNRS